MSFGIRCGRAGQWLESHRLYQASPVFPGPSPRRWARPPETATLWTMLPVTPPVPCVTAARQVGFSDAGFSGTFLWTRESHLAAAVSTGSIVS